MRKEESLATGPPGFHFPTVRVIALGNRMSPSNYILTHSLALMQLRLTITLFVWHFDAELEESGETEPNYKDAFVAVRSPLLVRITPRKRSADEKN